MTLEERVGALEAMLPKEYYTSRHSGEEIDNAVDRAASGGAIDKALNQKVNRNLLHNWYFADPIAQRGGYLVSPGIQYYQSGEVVGTTRGYYTVIRFDSYGTAFFQNDGVESYTNQNAISTNQVVRGYIGEVYGVDRWIAHWTGDGVTLVEDGCVSIYRPGYAAFLAQKMDADLTGKTITFSVIAKGTFDLNIVKCTGDAWSYDSHIAKLGTTQSDAYTLVKVTGTVPDDCEKLLIEFESMAGVKSSFKAAKLELGSQQTLAHQDENGNWVLNEIPNYAEELLKCQYYYNVLTPNAYLNTSGFSGLYELCLQYPNMRVNPAVTLLGSDGIRAELISSSSLLVRSNVSGAYVSGVVLDANL